MNSFITGTGMANRTGMPRGLKMKQREMKIGEIFSQTQGGSPCFVLEGSASGHYVGYKQGQE